MTTFETTTSLGLAENLRIAQGLVRTVAEQNAAEAFAYAKGWRECGEALVYVAAEAWEAGRADMEREVNAAWTEVAARSRFLGGAMSRTYEEKHVAELAACQPRPDDFPGVEADPYCLERIRASMEPIVRDIRRAA